MKRSDFTFRVEVHTGGSEALDGELQLLSYRYVQHRFSITDGTWTFHLSLQDHFR